jgi:hypothetical protein
VVRKLAFQNGKAAIQVKEVLPHLDIFQIEIRCTLANKILTILCMIHDLKISVCATNADIINQIPI